MTVEGKICEGFGQLVSEWIVDGSKNKRIRILRLANTLGLELSASQSLRYQLIHRTASAVYEAHRYRAKVAVMMVHSFDPRDTGVDDYKRFAAAIGLPGAEATRLTGPVSCEGVDLYLGWSADRASNEGFVIVNGRKTDEGFFDDT